MIKLLDPGIQSTNPLLTRHIKPNSRSLDIEHLEHERH